MAEEPTTTALLFKREADTLELRYGKPIRNALRIALSGCPHPENKRVATTATVSTEPGGVLNAMKPVKQVAGFYCRKCRRYVFQD